MGATFGLSENAGVDKRMDTIIDVSIWRLELLVGNKYIVVGKMKTTIFQVSGLGFWIEDCGDGV